MIYNQFIYLSMKKNKYNGKNVTGFEGGIACSAEEKKMNRIRRHRRVRSAWDATVTAGEMMDDLYDEGMDWDAIETVFYDFHHLDEDDEVLLDDYSEFKREIREYEARRMDYMYASRRNGIRGRRSLMNGRRSIRQHF